jgi:EAL domain-containing protein (putative c-di-GMP-specific phosphodiesterase class I)
MAKEKGRDQVIVYQPDGNEEQLRKGQISQAARIRESLECGRFRLWAQPIIPIHKDKFDWGVEILVRMQDENGTLVSPGLFIPAAERYNLMGHVDSWVISALCRHWTEQPEIFERLDRVAINLSGQSIGNDEFLEFVMTEIENHGVPWHKLCFEVTETAAVSNIDMACHFINTLKACGARFSLDDFGSGLSSFAYLKRLPVDYLKIDGAFVKDMLKDQIDAAMVRSISDVGRAMHLYTIAEFVEDLAVVDALRDAKVDYAQGYGICKPMPLEEIARYHPMTLTPTLAYTHG